MFRRIPTDLKMRIIDALSRDEDELIPQIDRTYMGLLFDVIETGDVYNNRTGVDCKGIVGKMIEHDMSLGFPLLTTKKVMLNAMAVELEGFIKGITDKQWYKDRKCNIWNEWCNPTLIPNLIYEAIENKVIADKSEATPEFIKGLQAEENDLGKIYGFQWGNFFGVDQLENLINKINTDPTDRRLIVSAWNPAEIGEMALPPCHVLFQVRIYGRKLHLTWYQRSVDVPLGLPFNIASYALLQTLIAHVTGYEVGKLVGFLNDCHIYENQVDPIIDEYFENVVQSTITHLPTIKISEDLKNIRDFDASKHFTIENYEHCKFVKIPVTV